MCFPHHFRRAHHSGGGHSGGHHLFGHRHRPGLISGYSGGVFDKALSLIMDSVYSFPGLILAIAFAAMLEPGIMSASPLPWP
jgi:hypothetical protein